MGKKKRLSLFKEFEKKKQLKRERYKENEKFNTYWWCFREI